MSTLSKSVASSFTLSDARGVQSEDPELNTKWYVPDEVTVEVSQSYVEVMKRKSGIEMSQTHIEIMKRKKGMEMNQTYIEVLYRGGAWKVYEA
jgi:hypothetical protein